MAIVAGDRGAHVEALQLGLIQLGYDLPRFGADGWYGDESDEAATDFAFAHGLYKAEGQTSEQLAEAIAAAAKAPPPIMPASIVDTRLEHDGAKRLRRRPWTAIDSITLHQTATCYLQAGAPREKRAIDRVSKLGVHAIVMRGGFSVLANGPEWEMPQAQRIFNGRGIGVEVDGWFAGIEGDRSTFWAPQGTDRDPMSESPEQTRAALELIDYLVELVGSHGGRIKHLHAHRQTSRTRRSDPGELLWRTIAIPAMKKHGLTYGLDEIPGPKFFVPRQGKIWSYKGPGRPIPAAWDPSATADY